MINGKLDIAEEKIIKLEDKQQKLSKLNTKRKKLNEKIVKKYYGSGMTVCAGQNVCFVFSTTSLEKIHKNILASPI